MQAWLSGLHDRHSRWRRSAMNSGVVCGLAVICSDVRCGAASSGPDFPSSSSFVRASRQPMIDGQPFRRFSSASSLLFEWPFSAFRFVLSRCCWSEKVALRRRQRLSAAEQQPSRHRLNSPKATSVRHSATLIRPTCPPKGLNHLSRSKCAKVKRLIQVSLLGTYQLNVSWSQ